MKSVFLSASADKSSITASKSSSIDTTVIGNLVVSAASYLSVNSVPFEIVVVAEVGAPVEVTKKIKETKSLRNHAECSKGWKAQFRTTIRMSIVCGKPILVTDLGNKLSKPA